MGAEEMVKNKTFVLFILSIVVFAFLMRIYSVTGQQVASLSTENKKCTLYDDFSSGILDPLKWAEKPGSNINNNWLDEHFVSHENKKYHTAQLNPLDAGVRLELLQHIFVPGEKLEYSFMYKSGSGNRIHAPDINKVNPRQIGLIGIWNGQLFCAGNDFGEYRVSFYFTSQGVDVQVIKPDGTKVICPQWAGIPAASTYAFDFITRTGHDGIVHMDYDNILICKPKQDPTQPLVAYWKFDEGFGTTTMDSTGNGNIGSLQNGVQWTTDSISGYALQFDGIDDKVSVLKTPSVDLTKNVILDAWIKRQSNTDGTILSKNGPYYLAIQNDLLRGGIYANDGNCPTSCITPGMNTWTHINGITALQKNMWYHAQLIYDGQAIKLYLDGQLEGSAQKIGEMPQVSQQVWIGWGEPGQNQYFTGILDELKISGK